MRFHRSYCAYFSLVIYLLSQTLFSACAQSRPDATTSPSSVTQLPGRVIVRAGQLREEVTALRDDVLRVRIWRGDNSPEDASWAVLAASRTSSVPVVMETGSDYYGFRTRKLSVTIDKKNLELTVRDLARNILQQDARPVCFDGAAFRIYKTMPLDEHYFGLGDKTGPLDRRNEAFTLWNTDAYRFQESTDPIYKSIPYFMTYRAGRAMGVLLDNTWRSSFDFGKESPEDYSFGAAGGPLNYYLLYGPSPRQVVETYAWLTGTPPLPPLWALGFQQSRYSYMSERRVLQVADQMRKDRIPCDALYLDIDFQEKNRPFTINRTAFPTFSGMIRQLHADHFHVVAITDLHIAKLPEQNYFPYDSGMAGNEFVKNPDGSVYTGVVWPGASVFPDFTRRQTRAWWGTLYRGLRHDGVDGFWNDMNEPSIFDTPTLTMPLDVVHRIDELGFALRTATHAEIHNVYGMENSRATFDGLKALDPGLRPFVLTRATYAGGQRYAATWTGDNSSSWSHLNLATHMLENLGLCGFAYSGADVGGYAGTPSPELLTRWIEVAAFQPIDRDHTEKGTGDQEPWVGGPQQEAIRRRFIETRYRLMPYLYTLAEEASKTGVPVMRPLFLEFPDAAPDHHPLDIDPAAAGEFLLGPDLLIASAPYPDEQDNYSVELPTPGWYDFWSGARVSAPGDKLQTAPGPSTVFVFRSQLLTGVTSDLEKLPVYVRPGSILPLAPLVQSTDITPKGPLTLRVYVGSQCEGSLYQDDGRTYAYQRGAYLRMRFSCRETPRGLQLTIGAHQGAYLAWWKSIRVEIYGWAPVKGDISISSGKIHALAESNAHMFAFLVSDSGKGETVDLQ